MFQDQLARPVVRALRTGHEETVGQEPLVQTGGGHDRRWYRGWPGKKVGQREVGTESGTEGGRKEVRQRVAGTEGGTECSRHALDCY